MQKERSTYITYNEGLEAKHLHLGNLVHDYKNPKSLDPYAEHAYTDTEQPAPVWARSLPLGNYALTLGVNSAKKVDSEQQTPDSADETKTARRYQVAAAAKTTKIEIKDPKSFFNEITLSSNEAKNWLSSHVSAGESLSLRQGKPHPRPHIWMLTGLILMTHTTWTDLSSEDQSFIVGLQAPFDPTGVSALRRLSVSDGVRPTFGYTGTDDVKHVSGAVIHETGKFPGTRCWAAKWQRVEVKILPAGMQQSGKNNQLRLKSATEVSPNIAVVELRADVYGENDALKDENKEEFDEEYWDAFLDASEQ